jgi:hypothetical protein
VALQVAVARASARLPDDAGVGDVFARARQDGAHEHGHADGGDGEVDLRGGVGVAQGVDVAGVLRPHHQLRGGPTAGPDVVREGERGADMVVEDGRRWALKSRPARGTLPWTAATCAVRSPPTPACPRAARAARRPASATAATTAPTGARSPASRYAGGVVRRRCCTWTAPGPGRRRRRPPRPDTAGAPPRAAQPTKGLSACENATRPTGTPRTGRRGPQRLVQHPQAGDGRHGAHAPPATRQAHGRAAPTGATKAACSTASASHGSAPT